MKIMAYLDFNQETTLKDIEFANDLLINHFIVTKYNGLYLNEISDSNIKEFTKTLKDHKKDLYAYDFINHELYLANDELFIESIEELKVAFSVASKLKVKNIFVSLPLIEDVLLTYEDIINKLKTINELAKLERITVFYKQGINRNSTIVYLLQKMGSREFRLVFEPAQIYQNEESVLVAYRHFKKQFSNIIVRDLDSLNNSELIGYGKVGLIDLFKRMNRDRYNDNLILDPNFIIYDVDSNVVETQEKKISFVRRFLTRKPKVKSYLSGFGARIFPGENKTPTLSDIYNNQISALKIIFKLQ